MSRRGKIVLSVAGALVGAFVGYFTFGFVAGLYFLIFLEEVPEGGTGNSRDGMAWFGNGGLVGAVLGAAFGVWLVHQRDRDEGD